MVHFLTARSCALQAAPWSQLNGCSKPNSRATTPTMPAPNHPQPAANAKIIAALFPLSCQLAEAAPRELSHQQRPPLRHLARATTTHFGGAPDRYLAGVAAPREARNLTAPVPCLRCTGRLSSVSGRRAAPLHVPCATRRRRRPTARGGAESRRRRPARLALAAAPSSPRNKCKPAAPGGASFCGAKKGSNATGGARNIRSAPGPAPAAPALPHCEPWLTRTPNGPTTYYH